MKPCAEFSDVISKMPPTCDIREVVAREMIGIVARSAKDQGAANELANRLARITGYTPRKYTRWQLFRSSLSMRFETFRERLALRIAPWLRDE